MAAFSEHVRLMRLLEYAGLDTSGVKTGYRAITEAIVRHDFRAAQVKDLTDLEHGKFTGRGWAMPTGCCSRSCVTGEICALMREVIVSHRYDRSRFLRVSAREPP